MLIFVLISGTKIQHSGKSTKYFLVILPKEIVNYCKLMRKKMKNNDNFTIATSENSRISDRFNEICTHFFGGKVGEFAKFCGIEPSNLSKIINGSLQPNIDTKRVLAKIPQINARWLMFGTGTMLEGASVDSPSQPTTASQCAVDASACEIERLKSVCEERERTISVLAETNKNLLAEVQQLRNYVNITSTKYIQIVEKTLASAMDTNSTVKVLQSQIGFVTRSNTRLSVSATAEENVHSEH